MVRNAVGCTFNTKGAYLVEVIAVDVRVHAEQAAHDVAHGVAECAGERYALSELVL